MKFRIALICMVLSSFATPFIGAIGVSGSTVEDDHAVATAGAEAAVS